MRNRVKELREEKGMSIEELSVKSGVSVQDIQDLENDLEIERDARAGMLLADALETIFEEIFILEKED